ncbi:MAG: putative transcriptional regulator [Marmoricola sp.]|nr:putative transcriptional regulator [Marmoricola sp.]
MDDTQAKDLGDYLRARRQELGLSTRALAAAVDVNMAQIVRLEAGQVSSPRAEVLGQIAKTLGVPVADLYVLAGYPTPRGLPNIRPYLRTKYDGQLSAEARNEIEAIIQRDLGIQDTSGPRNGEDEQ